jgi:hypothetical protein
LFGGSVIKRHGPKALWDYVPLLEPIRQKSKIPIFEAQARGNLRVGWWIRGCRGGAFDLVILDRQASIRGACFQLDRGFNFVDTSGGDGEQTAVFTLNPVFFTKVPQVEIHDFFRAIDQFFKRC